MCTKRRFQLSALQQGTFHAATKRDITYMIYTGGVDVVGRQAATYITASRIGANMRTTCAGSAGRSRFSGKPEVPREQAWAL
jgi:hypothetical protein